MHMRLDNEWVERFGDWYQRLGPETKTVLVDLLPDDWSFDGNRMLDFGSGHGRTLQHFRAEAERGEFWGADIDSPSIELLEQELCPPMHALLCREDPPLGLEYGSFDLIWAISVFTHLTDNSHAWLLELHRLLKSDGLLIATYIGRAHSELLTGEPWDEERVGRNILRHNQPIARGGPMVLMSDWWVREHWGRAFEIVEIARDIHAMSWAVMRKRDVELTEAEMERPGDDPREYAALLNNVRQLQREIEWTEQEGQARLEELRSEYESAVREYEGSRSWRLTRPLRAIGEAARLRRSRRDG
jgi:SAM-dependent methyltransferase